MSESAPPRAPGAPLETEFRREVRDKLRVFALARSEHTRRDCENFLVELHEAECTRLRDALGGRKVNDDHARVDGERLSDGQDLPRETSPGDKSPMDKDTLGVAIANAAFHLGGDSVVAKTYNSAQGNVVIVQWHRAGVGFGELTFFENEDGDLRVDTESMSGGFCLDVLRQALALPASPAAVDPVGGRGTEAATRVGDSSSSKFPPLPAAPQEPHS